MINITSSAPSFENPFDPRMHLTKISLVGIGTAIVYCVLKPTTLERIIVTIATSAFVINLALTWIDQMVIKFRATHRTNKLRTAAPLICTAVKKTDVRKALKLTRSLPNCSQILAKKSSKKWIDFFSQKLAEGTCAGQLSEVSAKLSKNPTLSSILVIKRLKLIQVYHKQMLSILSHTLSLNVSENDDAVQAEITEALAYRLNKDLFCLPAKLTPSLIDNLLKTYSSIQLGLILDTVQAHAIGLYVFRSLYRIYDPFEGGGFFEFTDLESCVDFLKERIQSVYGRYTYTRFYLPINK